MKKFTELNEGIGSAIRISFQITKANGAIFKHFENNTEYNSVEDIKKDLKKVAEEMYKKYVTDEEAPKFSQWYQDFEKSFLNNLKKFGNE